MLFLEKLMTLEPYEKFMNLTQLKQYENFKQLVKSKPNLEGELSSSIDELKKDIEASEKFCLSDYQSFLWKTKLELQTDYPSVFDLIKVSRLEKELTFQQQFPILKFSPLAYKTEQLVDLSSKMILQNDFARKKFSQILIQDLVKKISDNYNIVSYHNFSHGFNLSYILFSSFKADARLRQIFTSQEQTYALFAGLAHDINHSTYYFMKGGTNNSYETKMNTEWAKIAKNDAVLEKMHIRTFFQLMKQEKYNILAQSTAKEEMKEFIVKIILATDISKHFKNLQKLKDKREKGELDLNKKQNKSLVMENLFHACDIGNPCLEYDQYISWSSLLTYEFNEQAKLEEKNNLEVTKFFIYKGKIPFYQEQTSFLNVIILPLWKQLSETFQSLDLLVGNIEKNLKKIEDKIDEEKC